MTLYRVFIKTNKIAKLLCSSFLRLIMFHQPRVCMVIILFYVRTLIEMRLNKTVCEQSVSTSVYYYFFLFVLIVKCERGINIIFLVSFFLLPFSLAGKPSSVCERHWSSCEIGRLWAGSGSRG